MFSFFRKKPQKPETYGQELQITFQNDQESWTEDVHLLDILEKVMDEKGFQMARLEDTLVDRSSGFVVQPEFLALEPGEGGVQTSTIITVTHPQMFPSGLFEYQHSGGSNMAESLTTGFDLWVQTDYVTLERNAQRDPGRMHIHGHGVSWRPTPTSDLWAGRPSR